MAGTRGRDATRAIDLLGVVIDKGLHTHGADVEHIASGRVGGAAACLGGSAAEAAAGAGDAGREDGRWDRGVVCLGRTAVR